MRIELLDHFPSELDQIALADPSASFYQTSSWSNSIDAAFQRMNLRCLVAVGAQGIAGYLPFFAIKRGPFSSIWSMPFGSYGGPVAGGDQALHRDLLDAFLGYGMSLGVAELGWVDFCNQYEGGGIERGRASTQIIDLEKGFDVIWNNHFDKAKRRQTRKARREGLELVEAGSDEEISSYYNIYVERTSKWGTSFRYPESLFMELIKRGKDKVKLFLAVQNNRVLGGHMNFYFNKMVIAWNGVTRSGSDGYQASTFLYASLIKHACENGFTRYNLGSSLGKKSLERYKSSLGGETYIYSNWSRVTRTGYLLRLFKRILPRN
jgi:hypothetical protein